MRFFEIHYFRYPANLTPSERKKWKELAVKKAEERCRSEGVVYGRLRASAWVPAEVEGMRQKRKGVEPERLREDSQEGEEE